MENITIPELQLAQLGVVILPHDRRGLMLDLAASLAESGPLRVLDGGNQFNAYLVARALRSRTVDVQRMLTRIRLARAFTCYQVSALLASEAAVGIPTLVLDLLSTFYDENVPLPERWRLLRQCLVHLRRLSRTAPLVVSASPSRVPDAHTERLLDALRRSADQVKEIQQPEPKPPMSLFGGIVK